MDVDSAVINFNAGLSRVLYVVKDYGLRKGEFATMFCRKKDDSRIKECNRKASDKGKSSRKRLRAISKGKRKYMLLVFVTHDFDYYLFKFIF